MAKLNIKLTGSLIKAKRKQVATAKALGLKKIGSSVVQQDNPQIRGMLKTVAHLVTFEEIK